MLQTFHRFYTFGADVVKGYIMATKGSVLMKAIKHETMRIQPLETREPRLPS
jgi:hypothetical protein